MKDYPPVGTVLMCSVNEKPYEIMAYDEAGEKFSLKWLHEIYVRREFSWFSVRALSTDIPLTPLIKALL
jgi:hypothetical protein